MKKWKSSQVKSIESDVEKIHTCNMEARKGKQEKKCSYCCKKESSLAD